jgi:hypothetical protein
MKRNFFFCVLIIVIVATSCNKDKTVVEPADSLFLESTFDFSDTVRVYDEKSIDFVDLKVSSNNKSLISRHLNAFSYTLTVHEVDGFQQLQSNDDTGNFNLNKPDSIIDELEIEVISKSYEFDCYSISAIPNPNRLKATYPTDHYVAYKADIKYKYLYLKYIPVESDDAGFMYKWGYTNCWLCKWHWDAKWNWLGGWINYEWLMQHPCSNLGYYRMAVQLYTNTHANYIIRQSKSNPLVF